MQKYWEFTQKKCIQRAIVFTRQDDTGKFKSPDRIFES